MARILLWGILAAIIMLFGSMLVVAMAPMIAGVIAIWILLLMLDKCPKE